jgi:hypothetical protein
MKMSAALKYACCASSTKEKNWAGSHISLVQGSDPEKKRTWGDCYRCSLGTRACEELTKEEIEGVGYCDSGLVPMTPKVPGLQYGLYAAQIAWWLSFFPPERFMIIRQEDTKDRDRAVTVRRSLTAVLCHVERASAMYPCDQVW